MSEEKALSTMGMDRQIVVTPDQIATIKNVIFPEATDDELKLFIYHCQRKGTHPMDKLIHPIKRGGKVSFQSSIDYLRSEAETTGEYMGQDEPLYEYDDAQHPERPSLAKVAVYRRGFEKPFIGIARWHEYYPGEKLGFMWDKMPHGQLAKCAEALAFRKAFPKKLGDLYIPEETAQADNPKTAAGNKQAERSASVKPQGAASKGHQAEDAQFREATLDDEITAILSKLCNGDYASMDELLKQTSHYEDKGKTYEFGMDRLPSISANWKNKVVPKLKALEEEWERGTAEEG